MNYVSVCLFVVKTECEWDGLQVRLNLSLLSLVSDPPVIYSSAVCPIFMRCSLSFFYIFMFPPNTNHHHHHHHPNYNIRSICDPLRMNYGPPTIQNNQGMQMADWPPLDTMQMPDDFECVFDGPGFPVND